jgi:hypothetical protein
MPNHPALFGLHFHAYRNGNPTWAGLLGACETSEIRPGLPTIGDAVEALRREHRAVKHHAAAVLAQGLGDAQDAARRAARRPAASATYVDPAARRDCENGIRALVPDAGKAQEIIDGIRGRAGADALSFAYGRLTGDPKFRFEVLAPAAGNGVSGYSVKVTRSANKKDLKYFIGITDPRRWSINAEETFTDSYPMKYPPEPIDPLGPDPDIDQALAHSPPKNGWKGNLFEKVGLPLGPAIHVTEFRNVLDIEFTVRAARPQIDLDYSLYQSLTSSVAGVTHQGGIDVDFGRGSVDLDTADDSVVFVAGKNIRFTPGAPFHTELNLMALPFLKYFITSLTLIPF